MKGVIQKKLARFRGVLGNHHGYFIRPHHVNFGNKGLGPGGTIGRFPNRRIPGRPRFNSQIFLGGCRFKSMQTEATVYQNQVKFSLRQIGLGGRSEFEVLNGFEPGYRIRNCQSHLHHTEIILNRSIAGQFQSQFT